MTFLKQQLMQDSTALDHSQLELSLLATERVSLQWAISIISTIDISMISIIVGLACMTTLLI